MTTRKIKATLTKAALAKSTFASVVKEMAEPRLAASVRRYLGSQQMVTSPKFYKGQIVYNRFTKENGKVKRSYQTEGICMYEVSVPTSDWSWSWSLSSDWEESRLELSANALPN